MTGKLSYFFLITPLGNYGSFHRLSLIGQLSSIISHTPVKSPVYDLFESKETIGKAKKPVPGLALFRVPGEI